MPGLGSHAIGGFTEQSSHIMWLRDFLPEDVPEARILVYGYDTRIHDESSRRSIVDIAKSFLDYIRAFRAATEVILWPPPRLLVNVYHRR